MSDVKRQMVWEVLLKSHWHGEHGNLGFFNRRYQVIASSMLEAISKACQYAKTEVVEHPVDGWHPYEAKLLLESVVIE